MNPGEEKNMTGTRMARRLRGLLTGACLLPAALVAAQESGAARDDFGINMISHGALATVVFGLIGIGLTLLGYKIFEKVLPFDVKHELATDDNTAVGIVIGSMILGIAIIVAATIHS